MNASRYAELFLTESREHLSAINHWLLALERTGVGDPAARADRTRGGEAVDALFRAVHTVKGMSATMGYAPVAALSHELETLLDQVRRGMAAVTRELMDLLFEAADALERAIELSVADQGDAPGVDGLIARLRAATGASGLAEVASSGGGEWSAPVAPGDGVHVRVRLAADTPLPGVRAFLVVQRARALGEVVALSPSLERLQAEEFGRDFALRVATRATAGEIEEALRAAGYVDVVHVGDDMAAAGGAGDEADSSTGRPSLAGSGTETGLRQARHVRIDLRRLDALMNLIGELVITRGRLTQLAAAIGDPALDETVTQTTRLVAELQDQIMSSRMVPVWQVFDRFPRLVRDAARALGKDVELTIEGKEIELDRSMLDEIGDPVVHLLRNAVDHGIEGPADRLAAGKRAAGRLTLSAERDRSAVLIRVSDDGRGVDRARVLARARELGLVDAACTEMADEELFRVVARPGFSTAATVTDISGRGVGIDAVLSRVRALGGTVEMRTAQGQGTTVTVRLPLTLAIVRALLARAGGETYALPLTHVSETVELDPAALRSVKGREVLVLREEVMPVLRLRELMRLPVAGALGQQVVVLDAGERRVALVVDGLTGQQEVVVKQFDAVKGGVALFSGATILGDGAPALIIDVSSLL